MGQGGFPASGKAGKPDKGASVAVEAVAVGLLDAALEWEDVIVHWVLDSSFHLDRIYGIFICHRDTEVAVEPRQAAVLGFEFSCQ